MKLIEFKLSNSRNHRVSHRVDKGKSKINLSGLI